MSDQQPYLFGQEQSAEFSGPVNCLGITFESHEARRAHFLEQLKEKLPELWERPAPKSLLADIVEHHGAPYVVRVPFGTGEAAAGR